MTFWERRGAWALVVALVLAIYAPTLLFTRVNYDDPWLWSDDSPLRHPSAAVMHDVWFEMDARARHDFGTEYLPVRDVAVAIDMAIWDDNEHGPHATQLVLYALTVLGLGTLLVRFGMKRELAWTATLLWALHPLHAESVAWLSERKGILAGLFVVACGHAWVRYRADGRARWLVVGALAAVAGVWSKAPAMFAPAAFALWDVLVLPANRRRWIAIAVIGGATALASVPVVIVAVDAKVVDEPQGAAHGRLVTALAAQGHYVQGLVLTKAPSVAYPIQTDGPTALDLAVGAAAVIGSVGLGWYAFTRRRAWALAVLGWTWIWFLPISQLIMPVHILVADRFAYWWVLGGCIGGAWLVLRARGPLRLALTGALVCVLAIATLRAEGAWTSSVELWTDAVAENPHSTSGWDNLASAYQEQGMSAVALAILEAGLVLNPEEPYLLLHDANLLEATHRRPEALVAARRAAQSGHASTLWLYAQLLHVDKRDEEALPWAERAAARRPEMSKYPRTVAEILLKLDRAREAEAVLRRLLAVEPSPLHHLMLADALLQQRRFAEAEVALADATRRQDMYGKDIAKLRADYPAPR